MELRKGVSFSDYELLDSGNGARLERFGQFILSRPDPQCIWHPHLGLSSWEKADAVFTHLRNEKGEWRKKSNMPDKWLMHYNDIAFYAKLTPFKHTGVFPEQSAQWEWIENKMKEEKGKRKNGTKEITILNLFGYTGIASLVCAKAGASVTHVDASRPTIGWARENQEASLLSDKPIRWILDDAMTFVGREVKRGVRYDAIIMDPPIYGHGPSGKPWDFQKDFPTLLSLCKDVLSQQPMFLLINAYAISSSALMLDNLLEDLHLPGTIEVGELVLEANTSHRLLSTGIFATLSS